MTYNYNVQALRSSDAPEYPQQLSGLPGKQFRVPKEPMLSWDPEPRCAYDLELRARLNAVTLEEGLLPVLGYQVEISHGLGVAYSVPQQGESPVLFTRACVPGRGLVLRLSACQLKVKWFVEGAIDPENGAFDPDIRWEGDLSASVQPARGPLPVLPQTIACYGSRAELPMDATQIRFTDEFGHPVAPTTRQVDFWAINNTSLGISQDLSTYGDWQPIPHFARAISIGGGLAFAVFR